MTDLLTYQNDNGVTVHEIEGLFPSLDIENWYIERIRELKDDPYETTCIHIWKHEGKWYAERIWSLEFEDELQLDFEERNLGHPGHPHEYGDS